MATHSSYFGTQYGAWIMNTEYKKTNPHAQEEKNDFHIRVNGADRDYFPAFI